MENTEALTDTIQDDEKVAATETEQATETDSTTPQAEEVKEGATEEGDAQPQATNEPFYVRYNHEDRELTREEAVSYAQKGMKYDAVADILDQVSYLAAVNGKDTKEWLKGHIEAIDNDYRESLIDKYGDDEEIINLLMEKRKSENEQKYSKFKSDKIASEKQAEEKAVKSFESRMADEFIELQKEFPEYTDITQIPKDVLKMAKKGTDLTDAVLRYKHQQSKRIDSAKQTAQSNASASAGQMAGETEAHDSVIDALMKGLHK